MSHPREDIGAHTNGQIRTLGCADQMRSAFRSNNDCLAAMRLGYVAEKLEGTSMVNSHYMQFAILMMVNIGEPVISMVIFMRCSTGFIAVNDD